MAVMSYTELTRTLELLRDQADRAAKLEFERKASGIALAQLVWNGKLSRHEAMARIGNDRAMACAFIAKLQRLADGLEMRRKRTYHKPLDDIRLAPYPC